MRSIAATTVMFCARWRALALTLLLSSSVHADIVSIGDWPCQEWQTRRLSSERLDPPQMWLSGFMTGLASAHEIDVLAITSGPLLFKAMDEYCAQHPQATLARGGLALFEQLRRRLPSTPPQAL